MRGCFCLGSALALGMLAISSTAQTQVVVQHGINPWTGLPYSHVVGVNPWTGHMGQMAGFHPGFAPAPVVVQPNPWLRSGTQVHAARVYNPGTGRKSTAGVARNRAIMCGAHAPDGDNQMVNSPTPQGLATVFAPTILIDWYDGNT